MDLLGTKLSDRYEIIREIGRGGMGVVYLARDPMLERDVAVKLVASHLLSAEAEERFRREARVVAKMDHPGIVTIYDVGVYEGALFYVMPLVAGATLREVLVERSLRLGEVLDVGAQIADALDHSHALGIVHRDVRPENISVVRSDADGLRVRIMDFGLAQASFESQLTRMAETLALASTAAYQSPEQIEGREADPRSDVYALGVILFECIAGAPPFVGDTQEVLYRAVHEVPAAPSDVGISVDPYFEELVLRCLAKDPGRRPQTAREVAESLERYRSRLRADERARPANAPSVRGTRGVARDVTPFVGREREVAELQQCLAVAASGDAQLVLVSGDAGIGKTRLLQELGHAARARGIRVLHGRFTGEARGFPFQGFCDLVQEFSRSRDASAAAASDLADLAADLVRIFPVLSELPDFASEVDAAEIVTDANRRIDDTTAVFELLARTLARLAGGRPLVVMLEDLHGADVSVEALQYVVRRLGVAPILFAGSYRPSETDRRHPLNRLLESFRGDRSFRALPLGPLGAAEHRTLIDALLDHMPLSDSLAETLLEATEGNPFFTIELVRSLVDTGGIAEDEAGLLTLSREIGISSDALPDTIQQVVERQIERLSGPLRDILSVAAVIGRDFDLRDLRALCDRDVDVDEAVERFLREGLLEERDWRGDGLAFASRMVRDVLYARLPRRRRRTLHRRFAAHLEERYEGRLDRVYTQLLHHYSQGDVSDKAVEYGFQAALKALDAFSAADAISHVRAALEFLGDDDWEGDPALEGEARLVLAGAHRIQGNLADALREAERGAEVFEANDQDYQALRAALMAAEIAWDARKIDETLRWVDRGMLRARRLDDAWSLSRFLTIGATVANLRGEYEEAMGLLDEAERLTPPKERRRVPRGGRLVVGLNNPLPIAVEPGAVQTGDDEEVLANVYDRLVTTDARGTLLPVLCERWEMLANGSRFLLVLRPETFSDGGRLTAADVKHSFERAVRANPWSLPAAFASIRGVAGFLAGQTPDLGGIVVRNEREIEIELVESLPIFPSLLTDVTASIVRESETGAFLGTGPFRIASRTATEVRLDRNPLFTRGHPPNVDEIAFRIGLASADVAARFRAGEIDLASGIGDEEAETLLRDPRMRPGLADAARKETCFVLFSGRSPLVRDQRARRALAGVVRVQALVWKTLGRRAVPATGLVPPGMLGHDPGRRLSVLDRARAEELLRDAGVTPGARLAAAVSPKFAENQAILLESIFEMWSELGVRVAVATPTVDSYLSVMHDPGSTVDLMFARWSADYDDPDNFTYGIFHSRVGAFRKWWSSADLDELADLARSETRPEKREALYRRFESTVIDAHAVVPLFHSVDYRLVGRGVRNLQLGNAPPFVNYVDLGKEPDERRTTSETSGGGTIRVALSTGLVRSLDPALVVNTDMSEVVPNVFETLTRVVEGARIVPWLAAAYQAEEGGRRFRFRLRSDVRFHDGRRLTARDVRYSFERLLQQRRASTTRNALLPVRGARALAEGEAGDLEGFRIHSAHEFSVELDAPLPYFAVLLTDPCAAIVPEGEQRFDATWREQCAGTGPFRVAAFDPGSRIELERNPSYWRDGYPRAEGLVFTYGLSPGQVLTDFRAGRLSLASGLTPTDVEVLRHDPEFAPRYFEAPSLALAFAAFNGRSGPLADPLLRRRVMRSLDVETVVRRGLGRFVRAAHGIILPGLVGYDTARDTRTRSPNFERFEPEIELTVAIAGGFERNLGRLADELVEGYRQSGVRLRVIKASSADLDNIRESATVDMIWTVWVADFPDTDGLVGAILHSRDGAYGRFSGTAEMDRLIEKGRSETDVTDRHAIYRRLETTVARDAVLLPLFNPHNYRFARPEVEGVSCSSLSYPVVPYENLRLR